MGYCEGKERPWGGVDAQGKVWVVEKERGTNG